MRTYPDGVMHKDGEQSFIVMQDALRRTRPILMERAGKVKHIDKQDGSPVTETDIKIERMIQAELRAAFPRLPVFGEEGGYKEGLSGTFWLVDPIDGTKSFIQNVPTFTNMAALIRDGETIASIIYNPSTNDMYTAQKGRGAYKNGVRLDLGAVPLPPMAICKELFISRLNDILGTTDVLCERAPTGAGFGFTLVADGLAAARFNLLSNGYTHDYAPGALLISEAGGVIVSVLDDTYTYESRSFVACHPALERVLQSHVVELRKLEVMGR